MNRQVIPKCAKAVGRLPPRNVSRTCTQPEAQAALRRYQVKGEAVDPNNAEHLRAYMILRATAPRVGADKVIAFLANAQESVAVGKREEMAIWAVPVKNFGEDGPPDWMLEHIKTVEDLADECLICQVDIDLVGLYLIDQAVPRNYLGNFVRTLTFYRENNTGGAVGRPRAPPALADIDAATGASPAATACASPAAAAGAAPAAATGALLEATPQSAGIQATPQADEPGLFSARALKRMASGDAGDIEDETVKRRRLTGETLRHLSAQITCAAEKKSLVW